MISELFTPSLFPFTTALCLLFGLLLLEIVAVLLGGSLLSADADADVDLDLDVDMDMDLDLDLDADIDSEVSVADGPEGAVYGLSGFLGWLGFGGVPVMIWLAVAFAGFGISGMAVQAGMMSYLGFTLPPSIASLIALPPALMGARAFSGVFARLLPKTQTEAVSANHMGRRIGVISQGTAARGKPAEVRVQDRFGNTHHIRAEPLRDDVQIAQGTKVLVMRKALNTGYRLVALDDVSGLDQTPLNPTNSED